MKLYIRCADNEPETFTISGMFGGYTKSKKGFWIPLCRANDPNNYIHSIPMPVSQIIIERDHSNYKVTIPKWLLKKNNIPDEFNVFTHIL